MSLQDMGHDVLGIAATAMAAIAKLRETAPDLAIIDLKLADGSRGQDVGIFLSRETKTRCILLSASLHSVTDEEKALIQPVAMLAKPVLPGEVERAIDSVEEAVFGD